MTKYCMRGGIVVFSVLLLGILGACSSSNKSQPMAGVSSMDLGQELAQSFDEARSILDSINGPGDAENAVPQLESVNASLDHIGAAAFNASPEVRAGLSEIAMSQIPGLEAIADTAYSIPGVKPIVQSQVDAMLTKFAGFK